MQPQPPPNTRQVSRSDLALVLIGALLATNLISVAAFAYVLQGARTAKEEPVHGVPAQQVQANQVQANQVQANQVQAMELQIRTMLARTQAQTLRTQTLAVLAAAREAYPGPPFTGLSAHALAIGGNVPVDMVNGTGLANVYGGAIAVAPATYPRGAAADNAFALTHNGVPEQACNWAATSLESLFDKVVIGITTVKDVRGVAPVAFSSSAVATACNNDYNVMGFVNE